jgi:hypothetical protein
VDQLQLKLLARAVEISGGTARLRARLGVAEHALLLWLRGRALMPMDVFLSVVDIILEDDLARKAQDRRVHPRPSAANDGHTDHPLPSGQRG